MVALAAEAVLGPHRVAATLAREPGTPLPPLEQRGGLLPVALALVVPRAPRFFLSFRKAIHSESTEYMLRRKNEL